ncbi:MAG: PAS domain-containing protein [Alphaproteobacteria bacterium]|jgi:hypothetical protein
MASDTPQDAHSTLPIEQITPGVHRELYALWLGKLSGKRLPARGDFDPLEMPRLLPYVTLFDVEYEPIRFYVRLAGTAIAEGIGMEFTGHYLDEMENIENTLERCVRLVETRQPYFHASLPLVWSQNDFRSYSVLGLPLATDGETVDMILGALTFD